VLSLLEEIKIRIVHFCTRLSEKIAQILLSVIVTTTTQGRYLVSTHNLHLMLIGLADVIRVLPNSNVSLMEQILGKEYAVRDGGINVLSPPRSGDGKVSCKVFDAKTILQWGNGKERISRISAWITNLTNIQKLRTHIRPRHVQFQKIQRKYIIPQIFYIIWIGKIYRSDELIL